MSRTTTVTTDLFSDTLISGYVEDDPHFVERPWLEELVEEKLALPGCRFVLLTGEPGSGKTALLAWLAHRNPERPRYFIRRDSQVPLNSGDARSFLFAIGHQLASLRPGLFHPEKLEVIVRQHVDEIAPGGRAVGIRVDDLEVSPFYETAVRVEQRVGAVAGDLTGITAGRLVTEERLLDIANLQFLALLDPAEVLLREDPDARIVILVDALDELRYQSGDESALNWLSGCPELPANVRFLLATRPDARLLEGFRSRQRAALHEEAIDADPREIDADLTRFATRFSQGGAVADALVAHEIAAEDLVAQTVARADGNFQYLAALFRAVEDALEPRADSEEEAERQRRLARLLRLEEVPTGLGELYGFFLALIRDAVGDERVEAAADASGDTVSLPAWEGLYQPVLGVLAVAREPLTPLQIAYLGAIDVTERWLRGALSRLAQFTEREDDRLRLYHASLAEYLTAPTTRDSDPDDYLDPGEWHGRIAASAYRKHSGHWRSCTDSYSIEQTPAHLVAAIRGTTGPQSERLVNTLAELLCELDFLEAKVVGAEEPGAPARGVDSVLDDLRVAVHVASTNERLAEALRVLDLEAHNLRRREASERIYFVQQLHNRAVELGTSFLAEPAAARLLQLDEPHIRLRWRASAESSALERTIAQRQEGGTPIVVDESADRLVSVSDGHAVTVSDLATGREIHALAGHSDVVRVLALTPDRRRVLSSGDDGIVRLWDLERGRAALSFAGHESRVTSLTVTPDGRRALSGSLDKTTKIWSLDDGRLLHTLAHRDPVGAVILATGGSLAVTSPLYPTPQHTAGSNRQDEPVLRVWDVESGLSVRELSTPDVENVRSVAVTPNGRRVLASCYRFGASTLAIWNVDTGKHQFALEMPIYSWITEQIQPIAVSPDGSRAICASLEFTLVVWDLANGKKLHELRGHDAEVLALAVTPDGRQLLSASTDCTIRTWDLDRGHELQRLTGHAKAVTCVTAINRGRAISASRDGVVKVWQLEHRRGTTSREGHRRTVRAVGFSRDAAIAASGSDDGTAKVWEARKGAQLCEFSGIVESASPVPGEYTGGGVTKVLLDADGTRAVSASTDATVKVWDIRRDEPIHVLRGYHDSDSGYPYPVEAAALTCDGGRLMVEWGCDEGGKLGVYTLATGEEEFSVLARSWSSIAVGDAADVAVWRAKSEKLEVWDLSDQKRLQTLDGSETAEAPIIACGLIVCGFGGIGIGVWDLATGRALHFLPEGVRPSPRDWPADAEPPPFVRTVALSPNGTCALSVSSDGLIRVWDLVDGREKGAFGNPAHGFDVCASDLHFTRVTGISADSLAVFDLARQATLASTYLEAAGTALALSPDGQTILAGDRAGNVYCFTIDRDNRPR